MRRTVSDENERARNRRRAKKLLGRVWCAAALCAAGGCGGVAESDSSLFAAADASLGADASRSVEKDAGPGDGAGKAAGMDVEHDGGPADPPADAGSMGAPDAGDDP